MTKLRIMIAIVLIAFCTGNYTGFSQTIIVNTYTQYNTLFNTKTFNSFADADTFIKQIVPELNKKGFLSASIDSTRFMDSTISVYLFTGKHFQIKSITLKQFPEDLHKSLLRKFPDLSKGMTSFEQIHEINDYSLKYAEYNATPFASIKLEHIEFISDSLIVADLVYYEGQKYVIDEIHLNYSGELDEKFMHRYLDIHPGMTYDIIKLKEIDHKIEALPYLQIVKPWDVTFGHSGTKLNIYLKEKKANQANAIIGLQPSNSSDQKYMLTADIQFKIFNALGNGEQFGLIYSKLQSKSPKLKLNTAWPYILGSKIGAAIDFELFQKDTSFRKSTLDLSAIYFFNAKNNMKVYWQFQGNRVIQFDTAYIRQFQKLPDNIDLRNKGIGLEINLNQINNIFNPTKGYILQINQLTTYRNILINNAIDEMSGTFDYATLYDSIEKKNLQLKFKVSAAYFIPIGKFSTIKIGYNNAYLNGKKLFRNELFQIGGYHLLRGFDEESLYTNHYHIGTLEPRFLIGPMSFVGVFTDMGFARVLQHFGNFQNKLVQSYGINATFNTPSGIFQLALATGKTGSQKLQFRNIRAHFGYAFYF